MNMIIERFLSQQFYAKKGARKLNSKEIKEGITRIGTDLT